MKAIILVFVLFILVSCEKKPITSFDDPNFNGTKFYRINGSDLDIWIKFDKINDSMYHKVIFNQRLSSDLIDGGKYKKNGLYLIYNEYNKYHFQNDTLVAYIDGPMFKPKE